MSEEEETMPGWLTLDEAMTKLQTWEHIASEAKEQMDSLRHTIAQTLERDGGHTYHGDVGTATLIRTRRVIIDPEKKPSIVTEVAHAMSTRYLIHIPEHYDLSPLFMEHARDGVFDMTGVEVHTSTSVRIAYNAKKEKKVD